MLDKDHNNRLNSNEIHRFFEKFDINQDFGANILWLCQENKNLNHLLHKFKIFNLNYTLSSKDYFDGWKTVFNSETAALAYCEELIA